LASVSVEVEVRITEARCGHCEHLSWWGLQPFPFACAERWIRLPARVPKTFACECPSFEERQP